MLKTVFHRNNRLKLKTLKPLVKPANRQTEKRPTFTTVAPGKWTSTSFKFSSTKAWMSTDPSATHFSNLSPTSDSFRNSFSACFGVECLGFRV